MKNLIAVSGKIGSGKDTVGAMVNYLLWKAEVERGEKDGIHWTLEDFMDGRLKGTFEIKKFADKLKDMVCLLIGCTREQLEDRKFKEKELGEEWRVHYNWHYKLKSDSNPTGRAGKLFFTREESDLEMLSVTYNGLAHGTYVLTPRKLLQLLGTDCGRDIIHPNIWVNALFAKYRPVDPEKRASTGSALDYSECTWPNWLITDCRFTPEADAINARSGILIRVERPSRRKCAVCGRLESDHEGVKHVFRPEEEHASETGLDKYQNFTHIIINDGTLDDLLEKVRQILIKEEIL